MFLLCDCIPGRTTNYFSAMPTGSVLISVVSQVIFILPFVRKTIARRQEVVGELCVVSLTALAGLAAVEVATMAAGTTKGRGVVAHCTVRER